jgi:hypothetical protein
LIRERRRRKQNTSDNHIDSQYEDSSLDYRRIDRIDVKRPDQIYAYPRRSYTRQLRRYEPYVLSSRTDQHIDCHTSLSPSETKPIETIASNIHHIVEDQIVIHDECQSMTRCLRQQSFSHIICQYCQENFKTKAQLKSHLIKCRSCVEQT